MNYHRWPILSGCNWLPHLLRLSRCILTVNGGIGVLDVGDVQFGLGADQVAQFEIVNRAGREGDS